nr:ATP-binding protein [Myxococcota bacterium]
KLLPEATSSATIGVVETLVYRTRAARAAAAEELAEDGRLFRHRLAELGSAELPLLARPVRVARRVLELALGRVRLDVDVARIATLVNDPPAGEHLLVEPGTRALVLDAVRRQSDTLSASYVWAPIPWIVGPPGSGRVSLALAAAHHAGKKALIVRTQALPRVPEEIVRALQAALREALLFDAALVIRDLDVLTGDVERSIPDLIPHAAAVLANHTGPVIITAVRALWPAGNDRPIVVAELPVPNEADRITLWERTLGPFDAALARDAASRYRITGGVIEKAAASARSHAAGRGTPVELADLRAGVRAQLEPDLITLARRIEWQQTWDDLVLPDDVVDELYQMLGRVKHRRTVLDDWGFGRKVAKGVGISALFSGAPGTGKTMVAGLIARELQLDLYQIDVSRMVSKWVGETEKNLGRLFDAAAAGHAVLLFDEADSLFAKRTAVTSSNDRYANLEVNYLLQRMEAFEGITILTTNLETSIDEAFRRRLAFRIQFPVPEIEERKQLWQAMLPAEARIERGIDFTGLAERFAMSGGYIRNAVIRAAYLAADDGGVITTRHLQRAAALEYTAMGKIIHGDPTTL